MHISKTTRYTLRGLLALLSLTLLSLLISRLRGNITYAYQHQSLTNQITNTETQIQQNKATRQDLDQQIQNLYVNIEELRKQQQELKSNNDTLRQTLTEQKADYQEFLGFNSGS